MEMLPYCRNPDYTVMGRQTAGHGCGTAEPVPRHDVVGRCSVPGCRTSSIDVRPSVVAVGTFNQRQSATTV